MASRELRPPQPITNHAAADEQRHYNINFISEVNTFENLANVFNFNCMARSLWYRLFYHWNRILWAKTPIFLKEWELAAPAGLTHGQFLKARSQLSSRKLIEEVHRKGKCCGYLLIPPSLIKTEELDFYEEELSDA